MPTDPRTIMPADVTTRFRRRLLGGCSLWPLLFVTACGASVSPEDGRVGADAAFEAAADVLPLDATSDTDAAVALDAIDRADTQDVDVLHSHRALRVAGGYTHTCALMDDGAVQCWGRDDDGQLGDGSNVQRNFPAPVMGLDDAVQIVASRNYTCARRSTGAIVCWGANEVGQLGAGDTADHRTPVAVVGIDDATDISCGFDHCCVVRMGGAVWCWGEVGYGDTGVSPPARPGPLPTVIAGLSDAVQIAAGAYHSCAVRHSGDVVCWGTDQLGQLGDNGDTNAAQPFPQSVPGVAQGARIAAGGAHTCLLIAGGGLTCWGEGDRGQLGAGTMVRTAPPSSVVGIADGVAISGGVYQSCALRSTGTVSCWGANTYGQLGDGSTTDRAAPTPVLDLAGVVDVSTGAGHTCAVRMDGTIACWGTNTSGQLGTGDFTPRLQPAPVMGL